MNRSTIFLVCFVFAALSLSFSQNNRNTAAKKFSQLKEELPTPNAYRVASGAPGHKYWQQQADYVINVILNDKNQTLSGTETITYYNNSPDILDYLWIQLDQNIRKQHSASHKTHTHVFKDEESFRSINRLRSDFDGGFKLEYVKDGAGKTLPSTVVETMMRIDLPKSLKPGSSTTLKLKWWYNINDRMKIGGRSGMEFFMEDSNYLYTIAQFYPRMALYNDIEGWQNKQFLGAGEFTLTFGDYDVKITVPSDHIVASTGKLQNASRVLTTEQINRLKKARTSDSPVFIVTEDEAIENESSTVSGTKVWHFKAKNVRDFAFASSRKFIWDAMGVNFGNRTVMAMSYYPKEGNPLWEKYSTKVVAHTIKNYSKFTFDYPYPHATSIHSNRIGMEYPMICFNGGRPEKDGTYSKGTKYGMIGVIVHEVGHNYFPMIVNSDERQWTWMDEGLNTFLQTLSQNAWEREYPHRRDFKYMAKHMSGKKDTQVPIMTNSESLIYFGDNAYAKVTHALIVLRESVIGRDLFDYAFKTYSNRWMFKNPSPADFFRTMEDASGIDLDWFWRGWFYSIDHVDIELSSVKWFKLGYKNPDIEKPFKKELREADPIHIIHLRDEIDIPVRSIEADTALVDFYNRYDHLDITLKDTTNYEKY
ncbi:MAG: M1 family metallopeptidase, partial [Candidatus Neomarinimicrobiota bacterium]